MSGISEVRSTADEASDRRASQWQRGLTGAVTAAIVLTLFYAVMLLSVRHKSPTMDEPGHAVAGYLYWDLNDYRVDPENGNLPQRWIALPLWLSGFYFSPGAQRCDSGELGDVWFNRRGYDTSAMVFRGRAASAVFAVALGLVIWTWTRRLFGARGAMVALLLFVLNPAVLANGPLMTSDMAASLFFTLALWRIWSTLEKITLWGLAGSVLAVAGLFLSKMSAVLVLPVAFVLVVARIVDGRPLPLGNTRVLATRSRQAVAIGVVTAIHALGVILLVWGSFGFRFSALAPEISGAGDFKQPWQWMLDKPNHHALLGQLELTPAQKVAADKILEAKQAADQPWTYDSLAALAQIRAQVLTPDQTAQLARLEAEPPPKFVPRLIDWTRANRLLPEAYLYGYAHVWRQSFSTNNFAFLNGEVSLVGWRSFFPYVFLVKTPLALFGVALVALAAVGRQRKFAGSRPNHVSWSSVWHSSYSTIPLVVFFVIYWAAAISSHINIGHRHLLPVYPMIFILCGAAGRWFDQDECAAAMRPSLRRRMQLALVALIGVLAVEVTVYYPNYLAYFNGLVRPSQAYRHLVDSSLDWGQELPAVAQYLRAHRSGPAYFSYFGVGRPSYYGVEARIIGGFPGFDWKSAQHPFFFVPDDQAHRLPEFLRTHPDFDPNAFFRANTGQGPGRLLIIRPAALRLTGGTYLISATALQPMYYRGGLTWSTFHEAAYQRLRSRVQPWLSDDYAAKNAAMATASVDEWNTTFDAYLDYRFARLTAFLRKREPDDEINFSILVYRLTDRDLAQALDGASP